MTFSGRILSGVSQQLFAQVNISTFPYSIGMGSPLVKHSFVINVGKIWISHNRSPPQFWHFGIGSASGAIKSGNVSREYLRIEYFKTIKVPMQSVWKLNTNQPENLSWVFL